MQRPIASNIKDQVQYQHIADIPGLVLSEGQFSEFCFDRHFHLDYHVGLITEGIQRQRFRGKAVLWGAGCISLMPPGEIHDGVQGGTDAYKLKTFRIPSELLCSITEELTGKSCEPALVGTVLEAPLLAIHLVRLHSAMLQAHKANSLEIQSKWLILLNQLFTQSCMIAPQSITEPLSQIQLHRVRDYCFAHLAEKITLEELAALCGLGRFQFLRQFKRVVGMTPHGWLVRLRLEQACTLLSRGAQTVAQVAQNVGFYDQSHFNRAFRQAFGVAPSHY